jgi:hypothetical protein
MAGLVMTALAQNKLPDALALALKYLGTRPSDPVLLDALGEVRFRRGETDEAAKAFNQSAQLGRCNGRTHYDMARFLSLSGMDASAQRQLDLAHTLAPQDPEITRRWQTAHATPLPSEQKLAALRHELELPSLTDLRRSAINAAISSVQESEKGSCQLVTPLSSMKMPIVALSRVSPRDVMYEAALDLQLNGKKKRLEIDTGASGLLLTSIGARSAGLNPELAEKIGGIGDEGVANSYVTHVDDIKVGGMEFKNCRVQVLEPGNSLEKDYDVEGLIGPDVFQDYVVTLDFPDRQLLLETLPPRPGEQTTTTSLATSDDTGSTAVAAARDRYVAPEMKDWTPVFRSGHFLIFPTYIGNAPVKLFIMDSGSEHSLISLDAAREVSQLSGFNAPTMKGLNGEVQKVMVADTVTLGFAGVRQVVGGMTSIDTTSISRSVGVGISGFIGFPTLRELVISIDYRDDLVHVIYDPTKGHHGGQ